MSKLKVTKQDITKVIMPNKCDICTIGIGTSMFYYGNTWRPFKHLEPKVNIYRYSGGRIKVCSECLEELNKMKDPDYYIEFQLGRLSKRTFYGETKK